MSVQDVNEAPVGRRAAQRAERREKLIDAAFTLFSERGFEATTMDEIANLAGMSRRTAFRYFPTKESLVFPHRDERLEMFRQRIAQAVSKYGRGYLAVRRACLETAEDYTAARESVAAQSHIIRGSATLSGMDRLFIEDNYEQAVEEALGGPSPEKAIEAAALIAVFRSTLRRWIDGDVKEDLVAMGRAAMDHLESGAFQR